ncbi:MAG: hypothetical protein AAF927_34345, partial [Bacteroidota bacterium]
MKKIFPLSAYQWIIVFSSVVLVGLVMLQSNYILEAHQLKSEQIHQRLMALVDPIAIEIKTAKIDSNSTRAQKDAAMSEIINAMAAEAGFDTDLPFAVLQEKVGGAFHTPFPEYETELRHSPYRSCFSCIVTIQFLADSTRLPESEMTSMRTVEETLKEIPGKDDPKEFYWLSFYLPQQGLLIK